MSSHTQRSIEIYDTTLRDGSQGEGISFTVEDKIRIMHRLDEAGVDFIEGGWPGSNVKDEQFFQSAKKISLQNARLAAFGSTKRPGNIVNEDGQLKKILEAETPVVTIFGKSWTEHVQYALGTTREENLRMISESVGFLVSHGPSVIYDAEHFFDGYKSQPDYALQCLRVAYEAGAETLVLCDTNGGTLPHDLSRIVHTVRTAFSKARIGIHTHNDAGCAVANALAAVLEGAVQVQGTINGYGERCGNCDLIPVICALRLKLGYDCLTANAIEHVTSLSQFIDEVANIAPSTNRPYVGRSAFAHKGGVHADAVSKGASYEHVDPESVGNIRRLLVSELAGGSSIASKAAERGLDIAKKSPEARALLHVVAERENAGYSYEGAEGSFELLMLETLGISPAFFQLKGYRCIVEKRGNDAQPVTEATVKLVVKGSERLTVAEGDGPVHALDAALREALVPFFPQVAHIRLHDFKVRVVNTRAGTAAKVRVIIDSGDRSRTWSTIGVSTNMIEASWHALVDSIVFGLTGNSSIPERNDAMNKMLPNNAQVNKMPWSGE